MDGLAKYLKSLGRLGRENIGGLGEMLGIITMIEHDQDDTKILLRAFMHFNKPAMNHCARYTATLQTTYTETTRNDTPNSSET